MRRLINTSNQWRTALWTDPTTKRSNDHRYAQRDLIRQSLNEIANDLSMEMRDAALDFPVYMTVPRSGTRS